MLRPFIFYLVIVFVTNKMVCLYWKSILYCWKHLILGISILSHKQERHVQPSTRNNTWRCMIVLSIRSHRDSSYKWTLYLCSRSFFNACSTKDLDFWGFSCHPNEKSKCVVNEIKMNWRIKIALNFPNSYLLKLEKLKVLYLYAVKQLLGEDANEDVWCKESWCEIAMCLNFSYVDTLIVN